MPKMLARSRFGLTNIELNWGSIWPRLAKIESRIEPKLSYGLRNVLIIITPTGAYFAAVRESSVTVLLPIAISSFGKGDRTPILHHKGIETPRNDGFVMVSSRNFFPCHGFYISFSITAMVFTACRTRLSIGFMCNCGQPDDLCSIDYGPFPIWLIRQPIRVKDQVAYPRPSSFSLSSSSEVTMSSGAQSA